jgi:hypothetical protein
MALVMLLREELKEEELVLIEKLIILGINTLILKIYKLKMS